MYRESRIKIRIDMAKKYIDAEKLKAEIERRLDKHWEGLPDASSPEDEWTHNELRELGAYNELENLETFVDSLQQEQPSEICSKCIHHGKDDGYCYNPYGGIQSLINENGVYECTGFCEQEQPEVAQIDMAIEECSELINALCKWRRKRVDDSAVITEIADVQIMTQQLSLMFGEEAVASESDRKLERLAMRIEKHNINLK